jgi:hypothetical protein
MEPSMPTAPTSHAALAEFPIDPRVQPFVDALTDAQILDVLRQMNEAWSPEEDVDFLLGTPESNRTLVVETFVMNIGMGGPQEFDPLEAFAATARAAFPAPAYVFLTADPRVEAIVATLTDAAVREVLALTHQDGVGTADEPFTLAETAAENRACLIETFTLSLGAGAPTTLATLEAFAATARAAFPA